VDRRGRDAHAGALEAAAGGLVFDPFAQGFRPFLPFPEAIDDGDDGVVTRDHPDSKWAIRMTRAGDPDDRGET
jgi:hypothetical protein